MGFWRESAMPPEESLFPLARKYFLITVGHNLSPFRGGNAHYFFLRLNSIVNLLNFGG